MKFTIIPPQEAPRGLTAYAHPDDLLAHAMGFYAVDAPSAYKRKLAKTPKVKVELLTPEVTVPMLVAEIIPTPVSPSVLTMELPKHIQQITVKVVRHQNSDFDGDALAYFSSLELLSPRGHVSDVDGRPFNLPIRRQAIRSIGETKSRLYTSYNPWKF